MKKANLPVRAEQRTREKKVWNRRKDGGGGSPCVRKREIKRSVKRQCMKYECDGVILTQGASSATLRLPGCWWRLRPQGGAVIEGALTAQLLSPAALLITQRAAPAVSSQKTLTIIPATFCTLCRNERR